MEQVASTPIDTLKCKKHKRSIIAIVLGQENIFMCFNCLLETQKFNEAITLEELMSGESKIVRNWVERKDVESVIQLSENSLSENNELQKERNVEISSFIDEIQKELFQFIENEKKSYFTSTESISVDKHNLEVKLIQYSLQGKLKELIQTLNNENMKEVQDKITELSLQSQTSLEHNQSEITSLLSNYNLKVKEFQLLKNCLEVKDENQSDQSKEQNKRTITVHILEKFLRQKLNVTERHLLNHEDQFENFKDYIKNNDISMKELNGLTSFLREQTILKYNSLQYGFIKSQYEQSSQITQESKNIFRNKAGLCQSIQAEQSFSEGVHTFVFMIISLPQIYTHFYISLCNNKHRMYDPVWDCLCCNDSHFTGDTFRSSPNCLQSGSTFKVVLDFPNNQVIIEELKTGRSRKCSQIQLNGQSLRFALCWGHNSYNPGELPIQILYTD